MSMKKVVILAAAALTLASCAKTYELQETAQPQIGFGTWNDVMTKAVKTSFANNDIIKVSGFKWNDDTDETKVFDNVDVTYKSEGNKWEYSPLRFWDANFAHYTFFSAFPKANLNTALGQDGTFTSKELIYNGTDEVLLVAQKNVVDRNAQNKYDIENVQLNFKHVGSLVDIKVKKHTDIAAAKVEVTSIALSGIKTTGAFTVSEYDGDNNPVGTWAPTSAVNAENAASAATPYKNASTVTLDKNAGVGTANAKDLLSNLVLMPQVLAKDGGPQITISYKIITGEDATEETITFTDKSFFFGQFDKSDPDPTDKDNTDPRISAWMPGVHYTYYITINANAIIFTASIDTWSAETGHYYLVK